MIRSSQNPLAFHLILSFFFLVGCGDSLVLEGEAGGIRLSYDCASFESQAVSTSDHALVRDHAIRIVAKANQEEKLEEVRVLMAADAEGNSELVERLVVEHLCRNGGIIENPQVATEPWTVPTGVALGRGVQLAVGEAAPDFELPLLDQDYFDGNPTHLRLSDLRGSYVFLTFWATTCSPCLTEHFELQPIWEQLGPRGLKIFGIVQKGDEVRAHRWLEANTPTGYPSLVDSIFKTMFAYHVRGIPRSFLIGPSGDLAKAWLGWGPDDSETFAKAMDRLLPEASEGAL